MKNRRLAYYFFNFTTLGLISKLFCETPNLRILFASAYEGGERDLSIKSESKTSRLFPRKRSLLAEKEKSQIFFTLNTVYHQPVNLASSASCKVCYVQQLSAVAVSASVLVVENEIGADGRNA